MSYERGLRDGESDDITRATAAPSGKRSRRSDGDGDGGGTATITRTSRSDASADEKSGNIFARLLRFLREVVAELRKVIWPNRKQLITYTTTVVVFVVVMTAIVFGVDLAFMQGVSWLFG